ncbi:hypothetical protein EPIB1_1634 [Tritonibacter mobilis]|nr:hypothetical protein EPIB1_1634 [Tritonibacter mobilis]
MVGKLDAPGARQFQNLQSEIKRTEACAKVVNVAPPIFVVEIRRTGRETSD